MKYRKTGICIVSLLIVLGVLHAQESPTASGGDASGTGGTTSYSVGQVVYTANTGTNGSVVHGVQQSYVISITTGLEETSIHLLMNIYPNPTTNFLTLKIEDTEFSILNYQLYDIEGRVIESKQITSFNTTIDMQELPEAAYFLKVTDFSKTVKTFKIIKN